MPRQIHQPLTPLVSRRGQLRKQEAAPLRTCGIFSTGSRSSPSRSVLLATMICGRAARKLRTAFYKLGVDLQCRRSGRGPHCLPRQPDAAAAVGSDQCGAGSRAQTGTSARAPSIMPGMSAMTKFCSSPTEPHRGWVLRVVGSGSLQFRARCRDHAQQRGLADIREADQTDIGQQLQPGGIMSRLTPWQTRLGKNAVPGCVGVAKCVLPQPLLPPFGCQTALRRHILW